MTQPDKNVREAAGTRFAGLRPTLPEALVQDFASDPLAPFDKLLKKSGDSSWPLYAELEELLGSLPPDAIEATYADTTFIALYGKSDRLARVWMAERLLIEESARRRLESITALPSRENIMPYAADCLRTIEVDGEGMFDWLISPTITRPWRETSSASPSAARRIAPTLPTGSCAPSTRKA